MCDWARWPQEGYAQSEPLDRIFFSMSFARQMAEIEGEVRRIIRDEGRLSEIRNTAAYRGEPQTIHRCLEIIKRDPQNVPLLSEIRRAEKELYAFLSGAPDAPSMEYLSAYWGQYLQAYISELEMGEEDVWYMDPRRAERRERLLFGRAFDLANYRGGLSYFQDLSIDAARQLIAEGALEPDERHNGSPSIGEMLAFACAGEDGELWRFHGFAVSPTRADCRIVFEGMGTRSRLSMSRQAEFIRFHRGGDIVLPEGEEGGCDCWYD